MTSPAVQPPFYPVLFDLDGTLVDTAPGILRKLRATLEAVNWPIPEEESLRAMIGPPLRYSMINTLGMPEATADAAMEAQFEHVRQHGAADGSVLYDGVLPLLEALDAAGVPMIVATSRNQFQADQIVDHFDLRRFFISVVGQSEEEGRRSKSDCVRVALERLAAAGAELTRPVLIGDRVHDLEGAHHNNIPMIWSVWGYGTADEVAGCDAVAQTPADAAALFGVSV